MNYWRMYQSGRYKPESFFIDLQGMFYHSFRKYTLIILPIVFLLVSSCRNQAIMFRTKRDYQYSDLSKIENEVEYKIGLNDRVSIQVVPNKGALLVEPNSVGISGGGVATGGGASALEATVEFDGTLKMPLLGRVKVVGLSVRESELLFEEYYKQFFVEPFVRITVMNKRVLVFPGVGGAASVITLRNNNTSLLEAIATIGGIRGTAKAHKIKLIRGDPEKPKIYRINLSKIDNIAQGGIILQGNDIIYIEGRDEVLLNFAARVSPYLAVLNLGYVVYALIPGK